MTNYNQVTHRFITGAYRGILIQPKTYSVGDPQYAAKLLALVTGLRIACGREDMPICLVQMHSPGRYEDPKPEDPQTYVAMRHAQSRLAKLPGTTVVATYDLNETSRSQPDLGLRAGHWAAAVVSDARVKTGPSYRRHRVDGRKVIVEFDSVGQGLTAGTWDANKGVIPAPGAEVGGFQVAGADGTWHDARAAIQGATVVVTSERVAKPVGVRYAWEPEPRVANLYNVEGFPALPFVGR
jgi:sialate O-acetylesterase